MEFQEISHRKFLGRRWQQPLPFFKDIQNVCTLLHPICHLCVYQSEVKDRCYNTHTQTNMKSPFFRLAFFCDVSGVVHVGHNFGGAQGLRREGPILCWIQAAKSLIFFRIESCADFPPPRQTRKDFCRFQRIEVKPQWKWEEVAKEGSWCVYL